MTIYRYYQLKRFRNLFYAVDQEGRIYFLETYSWKPQYWQRARWSRTIKVAQADIQDADESKLINESELVKVGAWPIDPNKLVDQPPYEYYRGEDNDFIAKDGTDFFVFRNGWWEFVHALIPLMPQVVHDELRHSHRLAESDLVECKVDPIRIDNQICRLPDSKLIKSPLKKAMDLIETGSVINFYLAVSQVRDIIYIKFPTCQADYYEALGMLKDYVKAYEAAHSRAIEFVRLEHRGEDFSDYEKVGKWIDDYLRNHEKQYRWNLTIAEIVKNDETGKMRKIIDLLKKVHQFSVSKLA